MTSSPTIPPRQKRRFILLEDEPLLADLYAMCILDWFQEAEIRQFSDGNAAYQALAEAEPDMFIMDWSHPGLNGHELLGRLAERQARFVILLTSGLFTTDLKPAISRDLKVGYLPKPFGVPQFWHALNKFIGPSDFAERQALLPKP